MSPAHEPSLTSLLQGWSRNIFHRVYLLAGPDVLAKEEALGRLKKCFLGEDSAGMGLDLFDGNDAAAGPILSAAHTLPFFGERRLVVVRRAMELSTGETNRLADSLDSVPQTNCLVFLWDEKPDPRSVFVQAVRSAGVVTTLWPPFENQIPAWLMDRAQAGGKKMDRAAAQALLEAVGPSLPDLVQELSKLVLYAKERSLIGVDDVAACVGGRTTLRFMEWERALWRKDRKKALSILEMLRANGDPSEKLLPQVTRAIQKICLGKALFAENRGSEKPIFDRLWIRLQEAQADFKRGLAVWPWGDLLRALDRLVEADLSMKTGRGSTNADLTRLVWSLTEGEVADVKRL